VPEEPPAASRVRKGGVIGMLANEVAIVTTVESAVGRGRIKEGLRKVDLDEVPAGTESASRPVGDKEETIGRGSDSGMKGSSSSRDGGNRRFVVEANGGGSGSRNGSSRNGKSRWQKRLSIGIGNVLEIEEGRVIGGERRREPHIVVHLDIKRRPKGVGQWGMRMVEITEIWGINGGTGKKSRRERGQGLSRVLNERS
jgi:hypothetical protein